MLKVTEEKKCYLATRPSQRKVVVVVVVVGGGSPVTRGEEGSVAHTSVSQVRRRVSRRHAARQTTDRSGQPAYILRTVYRSHHRLSVPALSHHRLSVSDHTVDFLSLVTP